MAHKYVNRAWMTTATTGTGTVTLGSANSGEYYTFAEAGMSNGDTADYVILDGTDVEMGVGTYTSSGTTFSRDTVTSSRISGSAGTSKISLSGSATIFLTSSASEAQAVYDKLLNLAANSVLARAGTSAGAVSGVALAASQLLGRGSTGDVAAIALGGGLAIDAGVLGLFDPVEYLDIVGSSATRDGILTIADTVGGTVTSSLRPDTVFINRTYNGEQAVSGYVSAGFGIYDYIGYGTTNVNTSGSVAQLGGSINVYNSENGPAGRSEFTPLALAVVPQIGGSFEAGSNYYNDINMQSAIGSGGQEGFLAGINTAVQKWTSGNTIDSSHGGSFGQLITTTPNNTGFDTQDHSTDVTYPLNALLALTGWSGEQSSTATNGGQTATATAAAAVGLQIGGVGGVWNAPAANSYIPIGIEINDYTTAAIKITAPNSAHSPSGNAIVTETGAGNLIVKDSIYVGTSSGGGTVQATKLIANAPSAGGQAITEFKDANTAKWQIGKQTDNTFFLWDSVNSTMALTISTGGKVVLGETSNGVTIGGWFGTSAPVTKTSNFTVGATENEIISNKASTMTVTLPTASSFTGRQINIKTIQAQTVVSASSNVVPLAGGAAGTAILAATAGKWAKLVSDGTNWVIMQGN